MTRKDAQDRARDILGTRTLATVVQGRFLIVAEEEGKLRIASCGASWDEAIEKLTKKE